MYKIFGKKHYFVYNDQILSTYIVVEFAKKLHLSTNKAHCIYLIILRAGLQSAKCGLRIYPVFCLLSTIV